VGSAVAIDHLVVARSTMLDMHRLGLIQLGLQPGDPLSMHRETPAGPLA
jgi:hypothetical protein